MLRISYILCLCFVYIYTLAGSCLLGDENQHRTWTSKLGTQIEARIQQQSDNRVILETAEGKTYNLWIDDLSKQDRDYLERLQSEQGSEKGMNQPSSKELEQTPSDKHVETNEPHWFTSIDEAMKAAKKERKKIFILFTDSDFCAPCKGLKANVLTDDHFFKLAKKELVLVLVDKAQERKDTTGVLAAEHAKLMEAYPHQGVPWMFITKASGKAIGSTAGYRDESAKDYIKKRFEPLL